jgi:hypothetical protein
MEEETVPLPQEVLIESPSLEDRATDELNNIPTDPPQAEQKEWTVVESKKKPRKTSQQMREEIPRKQHGTRSSKTPYSK